MPVPGRIALVIPARNEAERLPAVLAGLTALDLHDALPPIVVDDGSVDGTAAVARAAGARVLRNEPGRGKGAALLRGCIDAVASGADLIALIDADGQHRPDDLPALLQPIAAGGVDVVLGTRRFSRQMPLLYRVGNRVLSATFGLLFRLRIRDTQCGMRAFTAAAFPTLRWTSEGYAVETEMLVRIALAGLRWTERPISTLYHDRAKGTQPSDGLAILARMVGWKLASLGRPRKSRRFKKMRQA